MMILLCNIMEFPLATLRVRFLLTFLSHEADNRALQGTKVESVQNFFPFFEPQNSRKLIFSVAVCGLLTFVKDVLGETGRYCFKNSRTNGGSTKEEKWDAQ